MAKVIKGLLYSESHEYVKVEGNIGYVGISDQPELINQDPYENWIIKVELSDKTELDSLMEADAYEAFCEK